MKLGRYRCRWFRGLRNCLCAAAFVGMAQLAHAESDYAAAWGPAVGPRAPLLAAKDQDGKPFVKAGQTAGDKQIWYMEQLLEGMDRQSTAK